MLYYLVTVFKNKPYKIIRVIVQTEDQQSCQNAIENSVKLSKVVISFNYQYRNVFLNSTNCVFYLKTGAI